ncbi:hypothetical protein Bca4012_057215 [Brassica carinata]
MFLHLISCVQKNDVKKIKSIPNRQYITGEACGSTIALSKLPVSMKIPIISILYFIAAEKRVKKYYTMFAKIVT